MVVQGGAQHGRCGVMARRMEHLTLETDLSDDFLFQRAEDSRRLRQLLEQPGRQSTGVEDVPAPTLRPCVDKVGRRRIGVLLLRDAGEQITKVIGNLEEQGRTFKTLWMVFLFPEQLVDGVELEILDAGHSIELFLRQGAGDLVRPAVPVGITVTKNLSVPVKKNSVNAPGIDGDAGNCGIEGSRFPQTVKDLTEQGIKIPGKMALPLHKSIGKTMHHGETRLPFFQSARIDASARRADVNRQIRVHDDSIPRKQEKCIDICSGAFDFSYA